MTFSVAFQLPGRCEECSATVKLSQFQLAREVYMSYLEHVKWKLEFLRFREVNSQYAVHRLKSCNLMETSVLLFPCTKERKGILNTVIKPLQLILQLMNYFKLLLQACFPCGLLKNEPPLYTKALKIQKSENPTYNPYHLHFFFLLPLTITYLLFRGRWTGQQKAGRSSER